MKKADLGIAAYLLLSLIHIQMCIRDRFQPFMGDLSAAFQKENIDLIMDVPLEVTVELGRTSKSIQDVYKRQPLEWIKVMWMERPERVRNQEI